MTLSYSNGIFKSDVSFMEALELAQKEGYTKWTRMKHYRGIYTVWCEKQGALEQGRVCGAIYTVTPSADQSALHFCSDSFQRRKMGYLIMTRKNYIIEYDAQF